MSKNLGARALAIMETHGIKTLEQAYVYLNDGRSHGDEYLAAASTEALQKIFGLDRPSSVMASLPYGLVLDYVMLCLSMAEQDAAAANAGPGRPISLAGPVVQGRRICAWCKKDLGPAETAKDTHGMCPECAEEMKKDMKKKDPPHISPEYLWMLLFNEGNSWDMSVVESIRKDLRAGKTVEPIEVYFDQHHDKIYIMDGHHRAYAAQLEKVPLPYFETDIETAIAIDFMTWSPNPTPTGYNSYGTEAWTSLRDIKELEIDRGNRWFDDAGLDLDAYEAIWVTKQPRQAIPYMDFPAETHELIEDYADQDLPAEPPVSYRKVLEEIYDAEWEAIWDELRAIWNNPYERVPQIDLMNARQVLGDDDYGFLYIRPLKGRENVAAAPPAELPLQYIDSVEKKLVINRVALQEIILAMGLYFIDMTASNPLADAAAAGQKVDHVGELLIRYAPREGIFIIPLTVARLLQAALGSEHVGLISVVPLQDELAVRALYSFEIMIR